MKRGLQRRFPLQPTATPLSSGRYYSEAEMEVPRVRRNMQGLRLPMTPTQALKEYGYKLSPYEQKEVVEYSEVWFLGTESKKIEGVPGAERNSGYDDENGSYLKMLHDHIQYRYEIKEVIGKGSSGQVVKCIDHKTNQPVAVKILRNRKSLHHQGLIEIKMLNNLRKRDREDQYNIIHMIDYFYFRNHLCITFELMGMNLYELIKKNNFQGFSISLIRRFAYALLLCLKLLRRERIIHCDFSPENILLKLRGQSSIKVIDFGSSCYEHQRVHTYIQSRFYRSPEVILGLPYSMAIDMWSFGCILAELYTGYPLFPGENEVEQLACIMEILGTPEPGLLQEAQRRKLFFDSRGNPRCITNSKGRKRRPGARDLVTAIKTNDTLFLDFIRRCLEWDPAIRMSPEEALTHEWILTGYHGRSQAIPRTVHITPESSSTGSLGSHSNPKHHSPGNPVYDFKKRLQPIGAYSIVGDQQSLDSQSHPQREGGITADGQPADKVAISQQFKEAMAEGFVESRSAKGIMMGVAGSGKTCSMCVILEEPPPPPQERQSTPLAQRPVRAVRFDVKNHSKLRQVKTEEMKRRLAKAINAQILERKLAKQTKERASTTQPSRPQASSQTPSQSTSSPDPQKEQPTSVGKEATSISSRDSEPPMQDAGTQEELFSLLEELKPLADAEEPLLHSDFVYIIDTGGQPQFHEVLPVFLRNASLCMFVIKLCERLDKIPGIEYFESGSSVCEPVPTTQTNEQILKHCVTTIHSHSGSETCPSILVIGTHRDVLEEDEKKGSCSETLQEKNQKVREILLPEFESNVISFSDSSAGKQDLIFPINAQKPGKDDRKVAELIRKAITLLIERTPPKPIPLRWYALELTLRDIAEKLDKLVLSWKEAFSVAQQKLLFSEESFDEAVEYLDGLNIILYYKDILPHVIFCDPHVLIEKISELAKCSFKLRNPRDPRAVMPEWRKFKEFGLISKHLLESEQLQKHFRPDLFTPADLIKLFKKLLLLADVSNSASEYFMPCLLPTLPSVQVDENRVSPSAFPAPLIVKLPRSTPRHGVFCSLISFLRSDENHFPSKWNIKNDQSFTPECLFRNCAKFEAPDCPAVITLIDSTDFIEVHVDVSVSRIAERFRHQVHLELCRNTQEALLAGLKKANSTLGYSVAGYSSGLKIAFACPQCVGCDVHAAEVKGDALVCDKRSYSVLQENHQIWYTGETISTAEREVTASPTPQQQATAKAAVVESTAHTGDEVDTSSLVEQGESELQVGSSDGGKPDLADAFRITFRVAKKWKSVGIFLKVPPHRLDMIDVPQKDFDDCLRDMLSAWLTQIDPPPTWRSLADAVRIINPAVAKEIKQQYCH